jgi:hypothetical protein
MEFIPLGVLTNNLGMTTENLSPFLGFGRTFAGLSANPAVILNGLEAL